ncbi:hypothetical protein CPB83DRAFT_787442 [Crepidotus variabilis]|uniref:Uncharacterized protein n=1 Tax=Crepidotus variabilis TaxID=179855 RepID=A0A9P6EKT1_9AGAR|nr:hypothetical protein CPB83DRAFT_787442 [Crepidotus variabilis]
MFSPTRAPGFGMPLNYEPGTEVDGQLIGPSEQPFPSILSKKDQQLCRTALPLLTLREIDMLRVMNVITDKPDWHIKVHNPTLTQRWSEETMSNEALDITPRMMTWILDELKYKAKVLQKTNMISVFNGDVVKSDTALTNLFKERLQAAIKPLEGVPETSKDWHPGSNGQVLDLVHPSLFPLVYGRSRVLENSVVSLEDCVSQCGSGVVAPIPPRPKSRTPKPYDKSDPVTYSIQFQWLPCEIDLSQCATVTSYINNLHPERHQNLYQLVGEAIDAAIPLWNHCLSSAALQKWKARIIYKGHRERIYKPGIGKFTAPRRKPIIDLRKQFSKNGLQVIVKLANIVLTPDKPDYLGGSWHIEGQMNEHICASALYYYSTENIENSALAFRQQSDTTGADIVNYNQDDHQFLEDIFGCTNNSPGVQVVGEVDTREGRLLVFPNILQHQVQPFSLKDPSKPGHRKILALFLVDPHFRILSTANVPPQQKDWWRERVMRDAATATGGVSKSLNRLPPELRRLVFDNVQEDFPIGLDEAKAIREELMEERKVYHLSQDKIFKSNEFSLCEH